MPSGKTVNYQLSGGDMATITSTTEEVQTDEAFVELPLDEGINTVVITTGIECQGVFEKITSTRLKWL